MSLQTITPREASIFACLTDTAVAPEPVLPPVRETDAALFFDDWMTLAPKLIVGGIRTLLYALELAPLALGFGHRMRQLPPERRAELLRRFETAPVVQVRQVATLLKSMAFNGKGQLTGKASDQKTLLTVLDRLKKQKRLSDVKFVDSHESDTRTHEWTFTLSFNFDLTE